MKFRKKKKENKEIESVNLNNDSVETDSYFDNFNDKNSALNENIDNQINELSATEEKELTTTDIELSKDSNDEDTNIENLEQKNDSVEIDDDLSNTENENESFNSSLEKDNSKTDKKEKHKKRNKKKKIKSDENDDAEDEEKPKNKKSSKKKIFFIVLAAILLIAIISVSVVVPLMQNKGKTFISSAEDLKKAISDKNTLDKTKVFVLKNDILIPASMLNNNNFMLPAKDIDFNGHTLTLQSGNLIVGDKELKKSFYLGKQNDNNSKPTGGITVEKGNLEIFANNLNSFSSIYNRNPEGTILIKANHFIINQSINSNNIVLLESHDENKVSRLNMSVYAKNYIEISKGNILAVGDLNAITQDSPNSKVIVNNSKLSLSGNSRANNINLKNNAVLVQKSRESKIAKISSDNTSIFDAQKGYTSLVQDAKKVILHDGAIVTTIKNSFIFRIHKISTPSNATTVSKIDPVTNDNKIFLDLVPVKNAAYVKITNIDTKKTHTFTINNLNDFSNIDLFENNIVDPKKPVRTINLSIIMLPKEEEEYRDYKQIINLASSTAPLYDESTPLYYRFSPSINLATPAHNLIDIPYLKIEDVKNKSLTIKQVNFAEEYDLYVGQNKVKTIKANPNTSDLTIKDFGTFINSVGKHDISIVAKSSLDNITNSSPAFGSIIVNGKFDSNKLNVSVEYNKEKNFFKIKWDKIDNALMYNIIYTDPEGNEKNISTTLNKIIAVLSTKNSEAIPDDNAFIINIKDNSNIKIQILENNHYSSSENKEVQLIKK